MPAQQRIIRERRQYNQRVASQTLEDYALRYTAASARKSSFRVGNTALGPIAFLACEAIGGTITIAYGFPNAVWAIVAFMALMFLIGLPIAYYAAKYGVDIDLLTRGAGFGYLGSTLTSLIYASFTFLLFSIEASILSVALQMMFGIPLALAHVISSLVVIPIAVYGISMISRMQLATQPLWLALQFLPIIYIVSSNPADVAAWTQYADGAASGGGIGSAAGGGSVNFLLLGMAASMLLSLLPQIGEQVDYLRFLPARKHGKSFSWWTALLLTGPGWVLIGGFKLLAGSFLAILALRHGIASDQATQPTQMYFVAFRETVGSPTMALALTGVFVIVCQLKINVTNAYAGSIAWSNFFSRLTHSHPGPSPWSVERIRSPESPESPEIDTMCAEAPSKLSVIWFGSAPGRDAEVVFELSLIAVVNQVDTRINRLILDAGKLGNGMTPLGRIVSNKIVALTRQKRSARDPWRRVRSLQPHANHRTGCTLRAES